MEIDKIIKLSEKQLKNLSQKSEFTIQMECVNWFRINKKGVIFSVPNEATRDNSKYYKSGFLSGVSDLIALTENRAIFIEMKDYKGVQSEKQKEFQKDIEIMNYEYHICRSLEQFKKIILCEKE